MNIDTIAGQGSDLKGQIKQGLGEATNDPVLQQDGVTDQISGNVRKGIGSIRDFARDRPVVAATLGGIIGLAVLNTLRGKTSY